MCTFTLYGCSDPTASNYLSAITTAGSMTSMCQYAGCNDTDATNYDTKVGAMPNA